jgi:hypothetical protein
MTPARVGQGKNTNIVAEKIKGAKENMKIKTRLVASAPTNEFLKGMIATFFYGKPENYRIGDTGLVWSKKPDGTETLLKGFRVIQKQDRFRFEAIID